jgi:hypothetical protein
MRSEVLKAVKMSMSSLVALMMEVASTSEKSVNFYQTTRRNNPEDGHLQIISSLISSMKKHSNWEV